MYIRTPRINTVLHADAGVVRGDVQAVGIYTYVHAKNKRVYLCKSRINHYVHTHAKNKYRLAHRCRCSARRQLVYTHDTGTYTCTPRINRVQICTLRMNTVLHTVANIGCGNVGALERNDTIHIVLHLQILVCISQHVACITLHQIQIRCITLHQIQSDALHSITFIENR